MESGVLPCILELSDNEERVEEDAHNLSARYIGIVGRMYAF